MKGADAALDALREIRAEFAAFCSTRGRASEADTRAKVVDRVLVDVLGWPELDLTREEHAHAGYVDYALRLHNRPYVVVEAKREGLAFEFPAGSTHRTLKLSGTLVTDPTVASAISQVRTYCDELATRFAIATNGYSWIVFRAIREDMPWREGSARVFPSLDGIIDRFTDFWNLLSYPALQAGALDSAFGSPLRVDRSLLRVLDKLIPADLPLDRNRLHAQLYPIIKHVFDDIADQDQTEVLKECYVHSNSLRIVAKDLNLVITDAIPQFLENQGAEEIHSGPDHAGRFERALIHSITEQHHGSLFLLLGGIGCGKTTFLRRYQRTVGQKLLDDKAFPFHIDLLAAPLDPAELERFVWHSILQQLRNRTDAPYLESRKNLKRAFAAELEALRQTVLRPGALAGPSLEDTISSYLEKWQQDLPTYLPKLFAVASIVHGRSTVVFIDNVDQLAPAYQAQVFLLAQRITRTVGCLTVVSLREESYYSAAIQKTFTAYSNRKFHIASPRFRTLIASRIHFALRWLEGQDTQTSLPFYKAGQGIAMDRPAIAAFLRIVEYSIFQHNRNIARFIEAICFGNMRLALQMFTTFLGSGATDVDKMLRIHRRDGAYYVAFHEFVKSIMLGDRRYYKESQSPIMNVFDCGSDKNSSHFTTLRVLRYLLAYRGQEVPEGQGYCDVAKTILAVEDVFDNREDVVRCLNRLVVRQLVETETRSTESIAGARSIRVTSAGWYYSKFLSNSFAYLDLVLQDTPLNAAGTEERLRQSVYDVDNLSGRDEDKHHRMEVRFGRVQEFLDYLEREELDERKRCSLEGVSGILTDPIVPEFKARFERERGWIEKRVRENRERFAEDLEQAPLEEGEDEEIVDDGDGADEDALSGADPEADRES